MDTPLREAMRDAGVASLDELARRLCEIEIGTQWPQPRSVSAKLGLLDKGKAEWWARRPGFAAALVQLLECERHELGLDQAVKQQHVFEFDDFPELAPLAISREKPCQLGIFVRTPGRYGSSKDADCLEDLAPWFGRIGPSRMELQGVVWLNFPPGTGRDLFWAELKLRSPYDCSEQNCIADAAKLLNRRDPICLNVSESGGERDLVTLARRSGACAVLVCAPFPPPRRHEAGADELHSWAMLKADRDVQIELGLTNPHGLGLDSILEQYDWQLRSDWQERLVEWVGERLASARNTLFEASELEAWLRAFEDRSLFDTPRSLIGLCRAAHHYGCRKLPSAAMRTAGKAMLDLFAIEAEESRQAFEEVVWDWLNSTALPWGSWISAREWRNLVSRPHALLEQMADEQDESRRRRLLRAIEQHASDEARTGLVRTRFIAQNERGDVMLAPRFLAELVARDRLCRIVTESPHADWGCLCFDVPRFRLVQRALGLMSLAELTECAVRVLETYREGADGIGATEALFCATGSRDFPGEPIPESLSKIADVVLRRMMSRDPCSPVLWTIGYELPEYWTNVCWACSLSGKRPALEMPESWGAAFPGWFDFSPVIAYDGLLGLPQVSHPGISRDTRRLLTRAGEIVKRLAVPPQNPPDVFLPHLVLQFGHEACEGLAQWWGRLLEHPRGWQQEVLAEGLEQYPEKAVPVLSALLICAVSTPALRREVNWLLISPHSVLRLRLLEEANAGLVLPQLGEKEMLLLAQSFNSLPPSYQVGLLDAFSKRESRLAAWFRMKPVWVDHLFESVLGWLDGGLDTMVCGVWLWRTNPARVIDILRKGTYQELRRSLIGCFDGDRHQLREIIELLEQDNSLFESADERRSWLLNHLPTSGDLAPRILTLIG